jgi:hypothetical protein
LLGGLRHISLKIFVTLNNNIFLFCFCYITHMHPYRLPGRVPIMRLGTRYARNGTHY